MIRPTFVSDVAADKALASFAVMATDGEIQISRDANIASGNRRSVFDISEEFACGGTARSANDFIALDGPHRGQPPRVN
jgi:hypothetical protein